MVVPTNSRIGMEKTWHRNIDEEIRNVFLKHGESMQLERFTANRACKSLSTVKMQQKRKESGEKLTVFQNKLLPLWSEFDSSYKKSCRMLKY
jgi:hypothetical protein